jgi:hypothetical protein
MFTINSFKNFNIILEDKFWIWERPFRVEDLLNSSIYKHVDLRHWMDKYNFDRWAIGLFVTKEALVKDSPIKRYSDANPKRSEFGELLDADDIKTIKSYMDKNPGGKNLEIQGPNIDLRLSSKGIKSKKYFSSDSQSGKGELIKESVFNYLGQEVYLYIFEKGSNSDKRARQLNGIVYEKNVRETIGLKSSTKGERWDAVGSLDSSYLDKKVNSGAKIYLNGDTESDLLNDYNLIPQDFLQPNNNWSIKSCSDSKNVSIYFADFKRISGLKLVGNPGEYTLHLIDKNLDNFILVVGLHTKGQFTKEYIINVKLDNWRKLIPDVSNRFVINKLEEMYNNLEQHRLGSKSNPGKRTDETELAWREYCATYSKITENFGIKLNFKRDTKGQLRIQCSMSKSVFYNELLNNNDYILIKY